MKHLKRLLALMLVVLMLVSVAACGETSSEQSDSSDSQNASNSGDSSSEDKGPVEGGTLVYGHKLAVTSIDTTQQSNAWGQIQPCVERLGRIQVNSDYSYLLVDDMIRDDDAMTVTLKVKEGVKFHDGSDLTPEVVKWNIDRYINSSQVKVIGNPTKCELNADGDVVVYFETYSIDWEYFLCFTYIYSKEYYDEHGENCYNAWAVGTGPYKMTSFEADAKIVYERFDDYHGGKANLDKIIYIYFADALGQVTAFLNNEIGWVEVSDANYIEMIEAQGYEQVEVPPAMLGCNILYWNTTVGGPWADKEVRQAVGLWGIDFDQAVYAIGGELAFHTYQWAAEGGLAWVDEKEDLYYYDKDKALQMLSDAGYPNGFETTVIAHTGQAIAATVLQSALKELNITSEVELASSVNSIRDEGTTPGIYIGGYGVQLNQTQNFTSHWAPGGNMKNCWTFTDEAYEIVDRIKMATSQEDKIAAMQDYVTWMCFTECLATPLYCTTNYYYCQDYIYGLNECTEYNHVRFEDMWIDGGSLSGI